MILIPQYQTIIFEFVPTPLAAGGVGIYIDNSLKYKIIEKTSNESYQALWIEIQSLKNANIICGIIYRQHNSPERFLTYFEETIEKMSSSGKPIYLMGDFNINLLRYETCNHAQNFIHSMQSFNLTSTIDKATRVYNGSATHIDNIFVSKLDNKIVSGNIVSDISDHYSQFLVTCSNMRNKTNLIIKNFIRDYSKFSETNFINDLSRTGLNHVVELCGSDVDKSFSTY